MPGHVREALNDLIFVQSHLPPDRDGGQRIARAVLAEHRHEDATADAAVQMEMHAVLIAFDVGGEEIVGRLQTERDALAAILSWAKAKLGSTFGLRCKSNHRAITPSTHRQHRSAH